GILLGPILLWKRRWAAVAGSILGILAILGASMLVAGIPAFLAYPSTLLVQSDFSGSAEPLTAPYLMTNGRGLVLRLLPGLADEPGMLLTLVLSAVIVSGVVLAWRGRWAPREARFTAQMTLLVLATVLANYHSHAYGAALLAMPLAELWT